MVDMSAYHALTAELHAGFLTLAFACIMAVVVCQITVRLQKRMPKILVSWAIRTRGYFEAAGYVGAVLGILGLLLSAWTGMYAWPYDVLINEPIVRNKIMLTAFSTVMWTGVVFIRARFGRGLWTCPTMTSVYVALTFVSFGVLGTTGSMGAHITKGGSAMDPIWSLVGFQVTSDLILDSNVAALVALASMGTIVLSLFIAKRYDLFQMKLGAETCQKIFKWDEPRIEAEIPKGTA
jgi:hypothetical protein